MRWMRNFEGWEAIESRSSHRRRRL
jgi:hypothetical protein